MLPALERILQATGFTARIIPEEEDNGEGIRVTGWQGPGNRHAGACRRLTGPGPGQEQPTTGRLGPDGDHQTRRYPETGAGRAERAEADCPGPSAPSKIPPETGISGGPALLRLVNACI